MTQVPHVVSTGSPSGNGHYITRLRPKEERVKFRREDEDVRLRREIRVLLAEGLEAKEICAIQGCAGFGVNEINGTPSIGALTKAFNGAEVRAGAENLERDHGFSDPFRRHRAVDCEDEACPRCGNEAAMIERIDRRRSFVAVGVDSGRRVTSVGVIPGRSARKCGKFVMGSSVDVVDSECHIIRWCRREL